MNPIITVTGLNEPGVSRGHAQPGRVGLSGGVTLIDKAIGRAERHLDNERRGVSGRIRFCSRAGGPTATTG